MMETQPCVHGYTWCCPNYCVQTYPKQQYAPETWRECGACFDIMAMKRTEECPEHKKQ